MAAGKPLFAGDTVVETLAAVVTRTLDRTAAPAALRLNWNALSDGALERRSRSIRQFSSLIRMFA